MLKVFQIQLTDAEIGTLNREGWESTNERIRAYGTRSFESTFKSENFKHYDYVADVDTNDHEEAFMLMNLWEDESKITRRHDKVSSMSVGDIIEDEDGNLFRVASFGFTKIN